MKRRIFALLVAALSLACITYSQTTATSVGPALRISLQNPEVTAWQIRHYVVNRIPKLTVPATANEWTAESESLRRRILDVAFHGWPREWIDAPPKVEDLGEIAAGKGYRLRKLRYEIVPGFQTTALLYEPEKVVGKAPAILDVNGHEPEGKAMEYIQKRCINQARQGIVALNPEWIGMGELANPENVHWNNAYLDSAGANALGLFYLAMRRGLDYLYADPGIDRTRIGITGLSGGGWQSIVLAALDKRIYAAVPDAGYRPVETVGGGEWIGDNEQSATDLNRSSDYITLTAMRAPRPTLLIYNENDNCCFRAPRMKLYLDDMVRPVFDLFHAEDRFYWYENTDPGDHNYQLDNRLKSYAFFEKYFGLPLTAGESPADADIKSREELSVGLPANNLTTFTLARQFADHVVHKPIPMEADKRTEWTKEQRYLLQETIRYQPVHVTAAWPVANTWGEGLKSIGYRFDFDDGLSAGAHSLQSIAVTGNAPWAIVLNDDGKKASSAIVSDKVNCGEQVLALDVLFLGDAAPLPHYYPVYDRMLATTGSRSLGMEVAQLLETSRWLRTNSGHSRGRLEATGARSQAIVFVAAAFHPDYFSEVVAHRGLESWSEIFSRPIPYQRAPELFCLDLYRYFDLSQLRALASPVKFIEAN